MKVIDQMLKDLGVRQFMGPVLAIDPFGERYTTLASSGVKEEGEEYMAFASNEEDAISFYCDTLQKWLAGRTIIFWRMRPDLKVDEMHFLGGKVVQKWTVFSRLTAYEANEVKEILP